MKQLQCFSFMKNTAGVCELWKEDIIEVLSIARATLHFIELCNILTRT